MRWRWLMLLAAPVLWVAVLDVAPLAEMARISLLDAYPTLPGRPGSYGFGNYAALVGNPIYRGAFLRSLLFAAGCTALALLIAYPLAYYVALVLPPRRRAAALLLLSAPFWTSEIVRVFAIMQLFGAGGAVNAALLRTGLVATPARLLYTPFSLGFGMVSAVLLSMLLPLVDALGRLPRPLLDAAADLGAGSWRRLWRVTLPLTAGGIAAGCILAFLLSSGAFAVPALLGGPDTTLFAMIIAGFFGSGADRWPMGAAFGLALLAATLLASGALARLRRA
jgi:spermidine/putrescine transport system permease protein